jgi:hypothetical protein
MLKTFMASGTLDARLVEETLVSLIVRAKASSSSGKVRICGEMVSLLLAQNDVSTAEALEEIWNQIIQDYFCVSVLHIQTSRNRVQDSS